MENLNNNRAARNIMVAMICAIGFVACKKEMPEPASTHPSETEQHASITIRPLGEWDRNGGNDDEDEPEMQGRLTDTNQANIANETVELVTENDTSLVDSDQTDLNGKFLLNGPVGNYRVRIPNYGSTPIYTDVINLTDDIQIIIEI